jgi:hypothetical protein
MGSRLHVASQLILKNEGEETNDKNQLNLE